MPSASAQALGEPGTGEAPIPRHAGHGGADRGRGLLEAQAGEEAALDHSRLTRVLLAQFVERTVEVEEFVGIEFRCYSHGIIQGEPGEAAAALGGGTLLGGIGEYLAHGAGGHPEEVGAVLPVEVGRGEELEEGLVDECSRLECLATSSLADRGGQATQLVVYQGEDMVQRLAVTGTGRVQELRD